MSFSVLHIGNMLIKSIWSFIQRKGRAAQSSISYFHGPGKDSFSFKCEGGWVTLSRQRDGSWISGSFLKTPRQIPWPRGLTPASYSREYSLLSTARLTIGLFPCCMMGLFPCSRQTMEAWKRSSCLGPGGLLSKDEPHFESQPKKKQRCLEGEAVWIECGYYGLSSTVAPKRRPLTAISF